MHFEKVFIMKIIIQPIFLNVCFVVKKKLQERLLSYFFFCCENSFKGWHGVIRFKEGEEQ